MKPNPKWYFTICLVIAVNGHSVIKVPTAWKRRESKRSPCGGASIPTTNPNGGVNTGESISATWSVNAGDGNGPVTLKVVKDDQSAIDFSTGEKIAITMNNVPTSGTGTYPFTFTIPSSMANQCKGGSNQDSCHFQAKSTSNWYSCFTLALADVEPPAPACDTITSTMVGSGVSVCAGLSGKSVQIDSGSILDTLAQTKSDITFNAQLSSVYRDGSSTACQTQIEEYFCASSFKECPTVGAVCKTRCENTAAICDRDPSHASAFGCSDATATTSDIYGACPAPSDWLIHLQNRYVMWQPQGENEQFTSLVVWSGDLLHFKYKVGVSDLYQFGSKTAYDNCDFTAASEIGDAEAASSSANGFEWQPPSGSVQTDYYFGSSTASSCKANAQLASQKLKVTVVPYPQGSTQQELIKVPDMIAYTEPLSSSATLIAPFCWWFLAYFAQQA